MSQDNIRWAANNTHVRLTVYIWHPVECQTTEKRVHLNMLILPQAPEAWSSKPVKCFNYVIILWLLVVILHKWYKDLTSSFCGFTHTVKWLKWFILLTNKFKVQNSQGIHWNCTCCGIFIHPISCSMVCLYNMSSSQFADKNVRTTLLTLSLNNLTFSWISVVMNWSSS